MGDTGQRNFEIVVFDFFGALRAGDYETAAEMLDPDVRWQGLREDWVCLGREEVLETFCVGLEERRDVDALEFVRAGGDNVVFGARGPGITEVGGEPLHGQIFNVYTFRDARIAEIHDYRFRGEALAAAGVAPHPEWR
jgi:ketosteroid isomerase-like protein